MSANEIRVWTYWEGETHALKTLCEHSVSRLVGNLHVEVTLSTVGEWVELPDAVLNHDSARVRSDYVRTALLHEYGGVWLDSDVLLKKDVMSFVKDRPVTWRESKGHRKKVPAPSIGAMVFPFPNHPMLKECLRLYEERLSPTFRHSMRLYATAWKRFGAGIEVRGPDDFYAVPVDQWRRFWDTPELLDLDVVGLHLWAGAVQPHGRPTTRLRRDISTIQSLVTNRPRSVLAEYARRHVL